MQPVHPVGSCITQLVYLFWKMDSMLIVASPNTPATMPNIQDDEESWGSVRTITNTETDTKAKPDGTRVDTTMETKTHTDGTTSSVKTVRLSKAVGNGVIKEKVTVVKTDKQGQQTRSSNTNTRKETDPEMQV